MTNLAFKKAKKSASKLRLSLAGPSGSGKTFTALSVGSHLGKSMAVLDTERGSASLYADKFSFDVLELPDFTVDTYVKCMQIAASAGYEVLVIDGLTPAWEWLKEYVEQIARAKFRGNTWSAWSEGTPIQNQLIEAILHYPGHVIGTVRSKVAWETEKSENGKTRPVKVGLAPMQRDTFEYEWTICLEMSEGGYAKVGKTRWPDIEGKVIEKPGEKFAQGLLKWLNAGEPETVTLKATVEKPAPKIAPASSVEETPGAGNPPSPPISRAPAPGGPPLTLIDVLRDEAESVPADVTNMDMTLKAGELAKGFVGGLGARDIWRSTGKLDGVAATGKQLREFLDALVAKVAK